MNSAAVIYNWCVLAGVCVLLASTFVLTRWTRWARPAARWVLVACIVEEAAEVFNLYTHARWGWRLFWVGGPFLVAALIADWRSARKTAAR